MGSAQTRLYGKSSLTPKLHQNFNKEPDTKMIRKWWQPIPLVAKVFIGIGMLLSLSVFFAANYPFPMLQISNVPTMAFGLLFFFLGILVSVGWTCAHWFAFGWVSARYPNTALALSVGLAMLAADSYIRISSVFFAKSSMASAAVIFIPIYVGGIAIPIYYLMGWLLGRRRAA